MPRLKTMMLCQQNVIWSLIEDGSFSVFLQIYSFSYNLIALYNLNTLLFMQTILESSLLHWFPHINFAKCEEYRSMYKCMSRQIYFIYKNTLSKLKGGHMVQIIKIWIFKAIAKTGTGTDGFFSKHGRFAT